MSDSLALNPYFRAAYNSPSYYDVIAQNKANCLTAAGVQNVSKNTQSDSISENNVAVKEKDSGWMAEAIICSVLTVGAAALCKKAYNVGKGKNIFTKTWDGLKNMGVSAWNKVTNKVSDIGSKGLKVSTGKDGNRYYTIAGKNHTLKGDKVEAYAQNHNIDITKLPNFNNKKVQIQQYTTTIKSGKTDAVVTMKNGKPESITVGTTTYRGETQIDEFLQSHKAIKNKVEAMQNGKVPNYKNLTDVTYSFTRGDETFILNRADFNKGTDVTIKELTTLYRYGENSKVIKDLLKQNPKLKERLKEIEQGVITVG